MNQVVGEEVVGAKTGIEWTDATWNPLRGCSRVSEGCRNCYAEKVAYRFSGVGQPYEGLAVLKNGHASWTGKVELVEEHLFDPLKWGMVRQYDADDGERYPDRARRIFVNSMSDLFHESVPDEWIDRIFAVMALCPQHIFQMLTKRPERMLKYLTYHYRVVSPGPGEAVFGAVQGMPGYDHEHPKWLRIACDAATRLRAPLPNVWLGVSAEDQKAADERIPLLLQTPAAVRFLSCEPLLGPVEIARWFAASCGDAPWIDWVICGGESGRNARPMHPDWARSLRDQCQAAGVPFFFKQWGEWWPLREFPNGEEWIEGRAIVNSYQGDIRGYESLSDETTWLMERVGKKAAGALLDGRAWQQFPEVLR